jgi:acyl carrier protein
MQTKDVAQTVRGYLKQLTNSATLGVDDDIFAAGRLTSLNALTLVQWLEQTYLISVQGSDLSLENFRNVGAIARFVESKASLSSEARTPASDEAI